MAKITYLRGRQILDSRGTPTVEVDMVLDDGEICRGSVPSGASTGSHEAIELRDGNKNEFNGKSVKNAVKNINEIVKKNIEGKNFDSYEKFDDFLLNLDGTYNKSKLGANTILACSITFLKCLAKNNCQEIYQFLNKNEEFMLPAPLMNIINGGAHANNGLDIQEFMIVPAGFDSFSESLRAGVEIFHNLKELLNKNSHSTAVGDEGGFAPDLKSNEEALSFISEAVSNAGYKLGSEVFFALDVAATEIYNNKKYRIDKKDLNIEEISIYYQKLIDKYPIISIEDPLDEDDWDGWAMLTNLIGDKVQLVGDDLFVTNNSRLQTGIDKSAGNSILIKINQIGSISETLQAIDLAKKNNYSYIISHRSGETEDAIIADISVATNSGQIKTGSCSRTDRTAKYNQLLRIEDSLGKKAKFAKLKTFNTIA
ncbi:MAG: phosphopyruvate hydratase [Thermodesulfobacteriota bacterium]|nr:MAG: phosphopyruvate hydratase [Candidatus Dadabacteria bacterium]|tara:strand:+ start:30466 stop:31743 length:1278 start_codon:yes stop_codon:yes gene_type:complete